MLPSQKRKELRKYLQAMRKTEVLAYMCEYLDLTRENLITRILQSSGEEAVELRGQLHAVNNILKEIKDTEPDSVTQL